MSLYFSSNAWLWAFEAISDRMKINMNPTAACKILDRDDEEQNVKRNNRLDKNIFTEKNTTLDLSLELIPTEKRKQKSFRMKNMELKKGPVKTPGLKGLRNIGNTCFMNAVIQCLSNTKCLLVYLTKRTYMSDVNTSTSGSRGALIIAVAEVMKELWSTDSLDREVNPICIKTQIEKFTAQFMGYAQQDAHEFLRYLLFGLHEDVNRVNAKNNNEDGEKVRGPWLRYLKMNNSKFVKNFVGLLKTTLKCTYCEHSSETFDPFWDLSLPLPSKTGRLTLSDCLHYFTRSETLDGDERPTCSQCHERRKCIISVSIHKFPRILVIHLKRFSPTDDSGGKLNVTVDFPLEKLDMKSFAADNMSSCRYNLYALCNHKGTAHNGHYTAYCRHPYTGGWHDYNDSRVSSISKKSLVCGDAYLLFYEKQ